MDNSNRISDDSQSLHKNAPYTAAMGLISEQEFLLDMVVFFKALHKKKGNRISEVGYCHILSLRHVNHNTETTGACHS